jgi:hypothetical protein
MPACMLFCINCSHSVGICGGQLKPGIVLEYVKHAAVYRRHFTHQQRGTGEDCSDSQHGQVGAQMIVGDTAGDPADSSQAAEGRVAVAHLGARRLVAAAASAEMGRERASQGSCCCPPLRKERSASWAGAVRALQRIDGSGGFSMVDCTAMRDATILDVRLHVALLVVVLAVAGESCCTSRCSPKSKAAAKRSREARRALTIGGGHLDSRLRWRLALPG